MTPFHANSGVLFFPSRTHPAARSRATAGASSVQSCGCPSSMSRLPRNVGQPRVSRMSLIVVGMPSTGLSGVPAAQRRVASRAAASAPSRSTRTIAWTTGSKRSIASRARSVASSGVDVP